MAPCGIDVPNWCLRNHQEWEPSMSEITTIGLDVAKHVFQVHGIDAQGTTVLRKRLRRGQVLAFFSRIPRCVVGLEACATAHYWARELGALGLEVRLMPAQYVKAYIKRNKHDAADAEAICEAVERPTMRFAGASPSTLSIVRMAPTMRSWSATDSLPIMAAISFCER
jgi:Transposase